MHGWGRSLSVEVGIESYISIIVLAVVGIE